MSNEVLEIDGVSLRGQGFGAATRTGRYSVPSTRGENLTLAGSSGSVFVRNKPYEEGTGTLSLWAIGATTGTVERARNHSPAAFLQPVLVGSTSRLYTNLLPNPNVAEAGGWTNNSNANWDLTRDPTAGRFSGSAAKMMVKAGAPTQTNIFSMYNVGGASGASWVPNAATGGATYSAGVWVKTNMPLEMSPWARVSLGFLDAAGAVLNTAQGSAFYFDAQDKYIWATVEGVVAPPTAAHIRVGLNILSATPVDSTPGYAGWADAATAVEGNFAAPYFDGSLTSDPNNYVIPAHMDAMGWQPLVGGGTRVALENRWVRMTNPPGTAPSFRVTALENALVASRTYMCSVEVRNPGSVPVSLILDLADGPGVAPFTIQPGEQRRVYFNGSRPSGYSSIYKFMDISFLSSSTVAVLDMRDACIEEVHNCPPGDRFGVTYFWTGTPNASASVVSGYRPSAFNSPASAATKGELSQPGVELRITRSHGSAAGSTLVPYQNVTQGAALPVGSTAYGRVRLRRTWTKDPVAPRTIRVCLSAYNGSAFIGHLEQRTVSVPTDYKDFYVELGPSLPVPNGTTNVVLLIYVTGLWNAGEGVWCGYQEITTEPMSGGPEFGKELSVEDAYNTYAWIGAAGSSGTIRYEKGVRILPDTIQGRRQVFEENMQTLMRFFSRPHRLSKLRAAQADGSVREAEVEWREWSEPEVQAGGTRAEWTISYTIPNVWWRDPSPRLQTTSPAASLPVLNLTDFAGMTGIIDDGTVLVTGPVTNPRIQDMETGAWVQFTGDVPSGSTWAVNSEKFTSEISGWSVLGSTTHSGGFRFLTVSNCYGVLNYPRLQMTQGTGLGSTTSLGFMGYRKWAHG